MAKRGVVRHTQCSVQAGQVAVKVIHLHRIGIFQLILSGEFAIDAFSDDNGIIPRIITKVYKEIEVKSKGTVYCSFIQIYNEKIYDLLSEGENVVDLSKKNFNTYIKNYNEFAIQEKNLQIREDKTNGIFIEGLNEVIVENFYDCINLLKKGEKNRKLRATNKNEMSSRSHTIFTLLVENSEKGDFKVSRYIFNF